MKIDAICEKSTLNVKCCIHLENQRFSHLELFSHLRVPQGCLLSKKSNTICTISPRNILVNERRLVCLLAVKKNTLACRENSCNRGGMYIDIREMTPCIFGSNSFKTSMNSLIILPSTRRRYCSPVRGGTYD